MPLLNNPVPVDNSIPRMDFGELSSVVSNPAIQRPYWPDRGRNVGYPCVTINTGQWTVEKGERRPISRQTRVVDLLNRGIINPVLLTANITSLRKEQWIEMDNAVLRAYRDRLIAWDDLAASSTFTIPNGMGRSTFEYEAMSDPGFALVDMDALTEGQNDSPLFKLRSLPLPITHSDFWFSERRLQISRNGDMPLDTTMAEAASRRIGEMVEDTTIGVETGVSFGYQSAGVTAHDSTIGSQVYGYTNYPHRNTKINFTAPTTSNQSTIYGEVLAALDQLYDDKVYGPFMIYHSANYTQYMDGVFSVSGGNHPGETLRTMLKKIPNIQDVKRLDRLTTSNVLIFVQMTQDVARAVVGLPITTVQWQPMPFKTCFKVMCINVPQIRSDYSGNCGVLHGTTS